MDLDAVRAKLAGKRGRSYWRGLEEVAGTEEFNNWLEDEFPNRRSLLEIDRRTLLKFMGASMALAGVTGCRSVFLEEEKIVPYVRQPEEITLGKPNYYATAMPMSGYGIGVLVESREGRPIKIEGNPDHPESLGASSSIMQASILQMYDPDRSQAVTYMGEINTWEVFLAELTKNLQAQKAAGGAGLRILTEAISSPTLIDQIERLLAQYPGAKWYQYEPVNRDNVKTASINAFGDAYAPVYDFKAAKVVVSLDADFFLDFPGSLRYSREFMDGRRVLGENDQMNRLYAIESMPTLVGATADHRWPCRSSEILGVTMALAAAVGVPGISASNTTAVSQASINAIAADLTANRGASMIVPGDHLPTDVHTLCHAINDRIGAMNKTVRLLPWGGKPQSGAVGTRSIPSTNADDIVNLTKELNSGAVQALLIIEANPVYTAPSDLNFAEALKKCPFAARLGYYNDETSELCAWHLPSAHYLEAWSDTRAYDGTISIVQPLISPLFEGRSAHQILGLAMGEGDDGMALVQAHHRKLQAAWAPFEKGWNRALNDGIIHNTKFQPATATFKPGSVSAIAPARPANGIEINFRHDPTVLDGRFSNSGWLQELPKPVSKITWENAVFVSPRTAQSLGVVSEDGVEVTMGGDSITGPVWVLPGHPDDSITVHYGYGRWRSGIISNEIGFNAFKLRTTKSLHVGSDAQVKKIGSQSHPVATTQIHNSMEGRDIARMGTIEEYRKNRSLKNEEEKEGPVNATRPDQTLEEQSVYPDEIFNYDGPQWGMTVDMNTCIGCNACVTACQAENNIPVVGKDQVKRGREMHWIRIDRYYSSDVKWDQFNEDWDPVENPSYVFQPMMCVHCEKAPCEPVCPVGATMHSHEGLNQMVYNRCVGTRYCSNNCPYKVRRFNYLNFTDNQEQFTAKDDNNGTRVPLLRLLNNPDVTVRGRGVMEKCTYCVQRINDARIEAKKQGRDPKDGEIVTACQQACPTKTITFGNVADKNSAVTKIRSDKRAYGVLAELQTRPRTAYLGKIRNPNPEIKA